MAARALTARDIAILLEGELIGSPEATVAGVASLDEAGPGDVSFLASRSYLSYFQASRAGIVIVAAEFRQIGGGPPNRVVVADARRGIREVLEALAPEELEEGWGVADTAQIGTGARWEGRVAIGPRAVIGREVRFGADCRVGAGAWIGDRAVLGRACRVDAGAWIGPDAQLGNGVRLKPGARVGTDGFAFASGPVGHRRVPHAGGCRLDDEVEIGANAAVDRGSVGTTVIGQGSKLDNLVHVGHNARIGRHCLLMAQVGVAGSVVVGDRVVLAGQAGLADHLTVGDGARVAAQAGVIGDIAPGATVSGYPARDHRRVLRQQAALQRLTPLVPALERLTANS